MEDAIRDVFPYGVADLVMMHLVSARYEQIHKEMIRAIAVRDIARIDEADYIQCNKELSRTLRRQMTPDEGLMTRILLDSRT